MRVTTEYKSVGEFYPVYLEHHQDKRCRDMHFIGTTFGLVCLVFALYTLNFWLVIIGLIGGYGCAFAGHFIFEKNQPATFRHPFLSFACDFLMYRDMWKGEL